MGYPEMSGFERSLGSHGLPIAVATGGDARAAIVHRDVAENGNGRWPADRQAALQYCISNDLI